MTDPESTTLLRQAEALAQAEGNRLDYRAETDGQRVEGEVGVSHASDRWWVRAWAKVTAKRGAKPQVGAGIAGTVRWLRGK